MTESTQSGSTLDYATNAGRNSRLARVALVLSILSCPFGLWYVCAETDHVVSMLYGFGGWYGQYRELLFVPLFFVPLALATAVSGVEVWRIRRSRGKLQGMNLALIGLNLTILWWGVHAAYIIIWLSGHGPR